MDGFQVKRLYQSLRIMVVAGGNAGRGLNRVEKGGSGTSGFLWKTFLVDFLYPILDMI